MHSYLIRETPKGFKKWLKPFNINVIGHLFIWSEVKQSYLRIIDERITILPGDNYACTAIQMLLAGF